MIVKLLTEHHLEFLSLKGGCSDSSESTLVKMSNCWKSYVTAQFYDSSLSLLYCLVCSVQPCDHLLLTLLCVMFPCVFVTFSYGVSGKVWYLFVSILDMCHLLLQLINGHEGPVP